MLAGLACSALGAIPASAQDKEIKVGMVNLSLCCAYFVGMDAAVKDEASHFSNVKVLSTDAKGDVAKLTSDVEDLLNQNVNGLIISGAWIEAAPAALEAINQAGVPIVMVDRLLKGGDFTSLGRSRQPRHRRGHRRLHRQAAWTARARWRSSAAARPTTRSAPIARKACSRNSRAPSIQAVVAPGWGEWSADGGFTQMEDLLAKHDDLNAVFCENNSMCLGAQKAIADAGKAEQIFITSVDGEMGTLKEIMREGSNYGATGRNISDQIGRAGFNRAHGDRRGRLARKRDSAAIADHHQGQRVKFYDESSKF